MVHQIPHVGVLWSSTSAHDQLTVTSLCAKPACTFYKPALPLTHGTQAHVPTTSQPVLLPSVATGTFGVLTGTRCPLLPRGHREKREL